MASEYKTIIATRPVVSRLEQYKTERGLRSNGKAIESMEEEIQTKEELVSTMKQLIGQLEQAVEQVHLEPVRRGRGRPKGSKNHVHNRRLRTGN